MVHIYPQRLPFHLFDIEQVSGRASLSLTANEVVDECPTQLDERADRFRLEFVEHTLAGPLRAIGNARHIIYSGTACNCMIVLNTSK